jgi:U32 family peptidase
LCFSMGSSSPMPASNVSETANRREGTAVPLKPTLPELLAPAGDWDCVKAAVENGADAIYFGLEKFNARMRADNFTESDLPKLMAFLHGRGVKGYVTFNTLVFESELQEAEQYARTIIASGVDAAIVQDVGICQLIRQLSPDFPIHVSTQMTVTSAAGVEFARELGCNLVVLARECSLKEIEKILAGDSRQTGADGIGRGLPLEVFVHGALCVAYSGQCLTSEALGGRSANRGECAQACRMPYELISDGQVVSLGARKYLLSPQDLAGLEVLPELVRLGVASMKIEGRLKSPEYVASITRIYRKALDELTLDKSATARPKPAVQYEMEMAFSRGLHTGWFEGINNQKLVHATFGKKRGVYLGEVVEVKAESACVRLEQALRPGDGVVFDAGNPGEPEEGGRVYAVDEAKPSVSNTHSGSRRETTRVAWLRFGHGNIDFKRVHAGDKLWKTSDPQLERDVRRSFEGEEAKFQRPISMELHGQAGGPLTLIVRDGSGHIARCDSTMPLQNATKSPLTHDRLVQQLGRLGGTPFRLGTLANHLPSDVILPVSELNRLRREVISQLEAQRVRVKLWTLRTSAAAEKNCASSDARDGDRIPMKAVRLIVLVRNMKQLDAAVAEGVEQIYCEFEDPKKYKDAVARFRGLQASGSTNMIYVAPPRIFKTGEEWILKQVRASEADGYLVRNYDHLRYFANERKVGDYSLNVANHLTAKYFKNQFDLERVTASYDLNVSQLEALLQSAPPDWFEIALHQHMPMFHMEHCVFCAFLSTGTDFTNCGRPCDKHTVKLRDRVGAEHPLKADAGCRNTVFNARAQTGAEYAARLIELGARQFRIEFLNEDEQTVRRTIEKYRRVLKGELGGAELWRELKLLNQLGVTRGQMAGG